MLAMLCTDCNGDVLLKIYYFSMQMLTGNQCVYFRHAAFPVQHLSYIINVYMVHADSKLVFNLVGANRHNEKT